MKNKKAILAVSALIAVLMMVDPALASVESSLSAIQSTLITTILPLVAIVGLVIAGLSFSMGNPNARQHLFLTIVGAVVGFGAQSIVEFIQGLIH